jgi:hypothetical protein
MQVAERQRVGERSTMLCTSMNLTTNVVDLFGRKVAVLAHWLSPLFASAELPLWLVQASIPKARTRNSTRPLPLTVKLLLRFMLTIYFTSL